MHRMREDDQAHSLTGIEESPRVKAASRFQSAAAAALLSVSCAAAQAAYLVDTGTPVGGTNWSLSSFQSLGATFSLGASTTIGAVQGFIQSYDTGQIQVDLIAGNTPTGATLFSTSSAGTVGEGWQNFGGLNWAVGAGTYTVVFSTLGNASMRNGAPNPLDPEWFSSGGNWFSADYLDIGVRVSAIPEPQTYALMIAGLLLVAGAARRSARAR